MKLSEIVEQYYLGPEGETLFCSPYQRKIAVLDTSHDLIKKRKVNSDDRSFALVSAMISENYVDRILKLLLPTFALDREGAAARKINLLASFNIIPRHLTEAAMLLNKTRNAFAHNLDIATFSELDTHKSDLTKSMRSLCRLRKIPVESADVSVLFEVIFKMATSGIVKYEENVRFYTNFIRTPAFIKVIGDIQSAEVKQHNEIMLEALRLHQSQPNRDDPPAVS
jgi:hypothetical protein